MSDIWSEKVIAGCVSISNHDEIKFQFCVQFILVFFKSLILRSVLEYKHKKKLSLHKFSLAVLQQIV